MESRAVNDVTEKLVKRQSGEYGTELVLRVSLDGFGERHIVHFTARGTVKESKYNVDYKCYIFVPQAYYRCRESAAVLTLSSSLCPKIW
jgi:hypothetical protein